jgi:hypothetical protein
MPSTALKWWRKDAAKVLDEVIAIHRSLSRSGATARSAPGQVANLYAVLLSSQFQNFCRDLHSEAAEHIAALSPTPARFVVLVRFTEGRKLETGNPNPGNLGSDFGRLGFDFWNAVEGFAGYQSDNRRLLMELNMWRNAVSHHDFSPSSFKGRTQLRLSEVKDWRRACNRLAAIFDKVVAENLLRLTASPPW